MVGNFIVLMNCDQHINKNIIICMKNRMKSTYYDKPRKEEARSHNRKYFSKGTSPEYNLMTKEKEKVSYDFFQVTSPLTNPKNNRYGMPINSHHSGYMHPKKQERIPLSFYEMDSQLIQSTHILNNQRRGRSIYKKVNISSSNKPLSTAQLTQQKGNTETSKPMQSQQTNEIREVDIQQIHYQMVNHQQLCKKIVSDL